MHVVQFMFSVAVDRVIQTVLVAHNSHGFVCVVLQKIVVLGTAFL